MPILNSKGDPKEAARRKFAEAGCLLTTLEILARYADDRELVSKTLVEALRPDRPDARVCELGFGTGWLLSELRGVYPQVSLVGLDLSPGMASNARPTLPGDIAVLTADMERLPFADEAFDIIATCWTLYFMRDIDATLDDIKRALRPGGRIVAATVAPDHEQEMDALHAEACRLALGDVDDSLSTKPFDLESGLPIMQRHFARVDMREWHGHMVFPDLETVMRFWELVYASTLPEAAVDRVRAEAMRLAEAWLARDGEARIRRHGGFFVGYREG